MSSAFSSQTLRPRIQFDNSLRDNLGVKYYQISYRKGKSGKFTPLITAINRHYEHWVGNKLVSSVYNLGPKSFTDKGIPLATPNLFEIQPVNAPAGQWSDSGYDVPEETASAN